MCKILSWIVRYSKRFGHPCLSPKKKKKKKVWCNIWIIDISIENTKKCQLKVIRLSTNIIVTISYTSMQKKKKKKKNVSLALSLSLGSEIKLYSSIM